jgi:hypothetical protein
MISRNAPSFVLALSTLLLVVTYAAGADAQVYKVYKCAQPNGTVLYTDQPCKGGTTVDIRLGPADPAAPARLAHAQAELDAGTARRRAEEEIAAARRDELNRLRLEAEAEQGPTAPLADYPDLPYGLVYGPSEQHPHHRGSPPRHEETRHDKDPVPAIVRGTALRTDAP